MKSPPATAANGPRASIFMWLGVFAFAVLAFSHVRLLRRFDALAAERVSRQTELDVAPRPESTGDSGQEQQVAAPPVSPVRTPPTAQSTTALISSAQNRLTALEERMESLTQRPEKTSGVRAVAEYNVANPPISPTEVPTEPAEPPRRGWGHEQSVGPPDTAQASDAVTAWASREPDGGAEWLSLDFEKQVDVAEVRIRESFNPGAITKVTGLVNGQEVVLWEGSASVGAAPRDFVVPVNDNVQSSSIVVHLDTSLVPGWNEIDAVELVARDGSRQWASGSRASSTYAEQAPDRPDATAFLRREAE